MTVFFAAIGAAMGSFSGAVAWRLHIKRNFVTDRSECEHCHHKLQPLDLIPIFSWLFLRGKCRYCGKPIGWTSFISEVVMAALFAISFAFWPLGFGAWQTIASFGLWLVYLVLLDILLIYDMRWMLLPDVIVYPLIALSFIDAGLRVSLQIAAGITDYASYVTLGILAMAGVYWLLYTVSKGRWVGYGDVKLAIFMGAVLGWERTLLLLMLANVIGLLVVLPGLLSKKLTPKSHVPFGPFMIVSFVMVGLFGQQIIDWYMHTFVLA